MKTIPGLKLIVTAVIIITAFGFSCNKEENSFSGTSVGPKVSAIYCSSAAFSANAASGKEYSGTVRVPYTGGNGESYKKGVVFHSAGVKGFTATLQTGILANGQGNLYFLINGTADTSGTAYIVIGFGGQTCTLQLIVSP